jgi:hypothetical protein
MPSQAGWARDMQGFFAADRPGTGERCHLVVEPLPFSGWDWVVWASGCQQVSLYGIADSADDAKRAAEHAVVLLRSPQRFFLVRSKRALHRPHTTTNWSVSEEWTGIMPSVSRTST